MAADIRHFTVSTPAGTAQAAPLVTDVSFPPRVVVQVDWQVPDGPMGTMGFLLAMSGVPVLPFQGVAEYVVVNDKTGSWTPSAYPDSGGWQVWSFNTGANPHVVLLTFHLDLPARPDPGPAVLDPRSLYPAADLSRAGPPVRRR